MNNEGLFEPALSNFVDPTTKLDGVFWDNNDWFVCTGQYHVLCGDVYYFFVYYNPDLNYQSFCDHSRNFA
jgi:hypothetical protein